MMDVNVNNPADLRAAGMQVLEEALGPVGFARFLQQFDGGYGDYTKEKYLEPDRPMAEVVAKLRTYPKR